MSFRHPFQKLSTFQPTFGDSNVLLAATGPYICSFSLPEGHLLNRWPRGNDEDELFDAGDVNGTGNADDATGERPMKRPRLSEARQSSDESVEIISERIKGHRRRTKVVSSKLPNVSHLLTTRDGKHVIAVTADDKFVRVFEVRKNARLDILSERCMPKRLCAITLTPDETTIVIGDKFGDVYSLPLLVSEKDFQRSATIQAESSHEFKPSATELTVHTRGNLEALRQQREQKELKPKKEGPNFEHKLLLGHVSLLTDVAIAEGAVAGRMRQHILTADRDEHIRVSRGIPQTHVIEKYCSGHKEYVSKLCILPWQQSILVAGSGEPSLKVYHWSEGRMIDEAAFGDIVQHEMTQNSAFHESTTSRSPLKFAVSGIWPIKLLANDSEAVRGLVMVALEGLPILLSYLVTDTGKLIHHQTMHLEGNALDVTLSYGVDSGTILAMVSIDTIHLPGSCKERRSETFHPSIFCQVFTLVSSSTQQAIPSAYPLWEPSRQGDIFNKTITASKFATAIYEVPPTLEKAKSNHTPAYSSALGEFLYGLENLRKKRGLEAADAEAGEDEEAAAATRGGETAGGRAEVEEDAASMLAQD